MRRGCPNELLGTIFSGVQDILAKFQLCADGAVCPGTVVVDFFRAERQRPKNSQQETNQQNPRSAALFCSAVHSIALPSQICNLVANWIIARQYWIVKWKFLGLYNKKERQILRFNALLLVHLQGLEPWAH